MATAKERYEEWKKKKEASAEASDPSNMSGAQRHQMYKQQRSSGVRNDIASRLQSFQANYQKIANGYTGRFQSSNGYRSDSGSYLSSLDASRKSLAEEGQAILNLLSQNRTQLDESYVDRVADLIHGAGRGVSSMRMSAKRDNDYWSQWASEDDYKAHVARQEDYDAKKSYDLEKGQAEIDHLQRVLEEYKVRSRTMTDEQGEARLEAIRQQYGDEKAIKALISQKRSYLNQAKHIQDGIALSGVDVNEDFQQNSRYQSTKKANPEWWENGVGDTQYEWINNRDGFREEWEQSQAKLAAMSRASSQSDVYLGPQESPYKQKGYDLLRDHEIAIYNYYYAKEGPDKAQEYLDSIQETLNQRKAKNIYDPMEEQTLLELAFGVAAGLDQFSSGVQALFNTKDDYIPQSAIQMASGMVREDLADNGPKLPDWMGGASLGQVGYDAITTSANMAPSILTSVAANALLPGSGAIVGNTMMFASAAGNAYQEALNYGYDKSQARAYSTLVGASEAGLQYILGGIGALGGKASGGVITKMLSGVDNAFLRTAGKIGGNMLSEGFEEGLQEILTPMFKNFALHADEDINWSEAAYSFLLGALTAGFMEGPTTISNAVSLRNTGKQLQEADISANRLAEIGKTFAADTVAYQLAGRVNENTGAYTLGRLFNEIGATLTEQNVNDITEALIKEGLPSDMAKEKAKQMAQIVAGATLTEEGIRAVEEDTLFARAVKATIIDPNATWYQRTRGYNEALMALAKKKASPAKAAQQSQGNMPASDNVDAQNETGSKAAPEADTAPAKVKKISAINKGVATVMLEDGTEVNVRDADLDPDDGVRIETIANIDGISAADADYILGALRAAPGASAQMDSLGAREAYKYGFYGFSQEHLAKTSVFASSLTETQRQRIYELGQNARNATVQKETQLIAENATVAKSATTGIYFDSGSGNVVTFSEAEKTGLSKTQKAGVQAAMVLHKLGIGGDIYFFESYRNSKGQLVYKDKNGIEKKAPNGWYSEKDGSIHIDLNAGTMGQGYVLYTLSHELTHFIEQWSPKKYKALADFLVENYEKGQSMDKLVRAKQAKLSELRGEKISYKEAYSEVVADSMEAMLADGNVLDKLIALKAKDHRLINKMKQFFDNLVAKIRSIYKGLTPDSVEGNAVLEMKDSIEKLQQLFADALVEASENFQSAMESVVESGAEAVSENEIITDGAVVTDGEGNKFSIKSMKADIAEGQMFEDLKKYCGWTQKQVNELRKNLEDLVAYMTPFRDVLDMNETYDREGRRFSPYKPNSDPLYKISMDFSTLCSKRLLTQYVIENLQLRENRPMSAEEQMAIRDMLNEYRKVEKGLQVACAMCYVEAARLKSPQQINKWLADPATQMKNYFADKNADFANFIKEKQADFKESRGYDRNATKKDMSAKDVRELNKIRPKLRSQYQLSAEEAKIVERAQALPNSTYLTAGNLAALSETDPTIYAAYTAFVRTATRSKSLETDEPYYYGDSRRDNGNGIIVTDSFIESVNRENGMRFSSWSDWRIQHLLDYITAVIDNSVRGAAMHGYTKFGEEVRVLGKTGMMFNMSGVAGSQTGLNEDGSLSFSPTESIDANEAIQLREEFPDTAGLQCIGVGDDHIVALLRSDIIDYVIPYHVSGLNAALRAMANIHGWKDYTSTQHAAIDKSMKLEDAVDKEHWHEEPFYSEFFVGYDTGMTGIEAMRASADRYIQMCKDRGLKPKFEQFSTEENYWKLLIDRKMINQKTGNLIQQKPVTPTFDFGTIKEVVDRYVKNYDSNMEARALNHIVENWDSIPQRIRDLKKQGGKKAKKASKAVDTLANQTLAAQPADAKYSIREFDSSEENIEKNTADLAEMAPVYAVPESKLGRTGKRPTDIFAEYFDSWGNNIYSDELGDIALKKSSIKSEIRHGITAEKIASIEAIPSVIKEGKVIFAGTKAGSDVQRIVVCAPITIGQNSYYMGVMLQRDTQNQRLYLHNVAIEKEASDISQADLLTTGADESNEYLFITNILQNALAVKYKMQDGNIRWSDRDTESVSNRSLLANALDGVAQNDMERQKMQEYKDKISLIEAEEQKLAKLKEQIRELSFAKGPKDMEKLRALRDEATKTANRINTLDKMLLRLEAAKPLQDVLQREKKKAYDRAKQKGDEALAAYRERATNTQRELMEKWQESRKKAVAKIRETAEKRDARAKLQKLVLETAKWISYPEKTDVKCPDLLKQPYADFLNSIDMSSERLANGGDPTKNDLRLANAMGSLATALERVMASQDPTQDTTAVLDAGYLDLPANFVQKLRDMTEDVKGMMIEGEYVVNTMTAEEVRKLSQMIRTLNHAIREVSTLYANLRFANVEALGDDSMSFMDDLGEIQKTGGMKDFVQWDNALPFYAFKRFGKGGESVFEGLMDAQDKLAFLAQKIFDFQEKTWKGDEAKKWSEDTHTIDLPDGEKLTLTTADAMSIYCLSRRQQGLQHLLGGGVRVMGIQKGSKKAKDSRSTLTIRDIDAINSSLTDRQKKVAEAIQEFMSTTCSDWGNEISMKRFLTREFNEKFYFPIESNDENLPTKDPSAQQSDLFRLLNISATKPIDPRANNEVIIRNVFDVFTGHASDMARLNAFGMPLLDYMKWLNYREKTTNEEGQIKVRGVRKAMETAYGNAAKSYVLNLIKDVNGRPSDNGDPTILMKWMRTAKTASVGSSLRVATLQITSYPRAALVLSPRNLALGLSKLPNIKMAKKYCGVALWKSFGFYDTNISRSIEDQMKGVKDVKQKIIELSLKGAEWGDAITWGALWNACEYEVASTKRYQVGTEEFYRAVGKKLREVVYRTQVVDSTLTRSQIMRSKRGMAQEAAAFMSEPTLSANILMDAGFQFTAENRRTGSSKAAWKKTGKYVTRAIAVYSVGQLTAALMEGLWDAWRDDDDEEFGEKYIRAFKENLALDLVPFNKIPIISDVFEAVLAMFDVGYYSSDKMSTTWLTQAVSAVDAWKDVLGGNSSITTYNALYKTMRAMSSFFGVSISGVMREGVALWNNTAGAYDLTLKVLTYDRTKAEKGELLLDAIINGDDRQADSLRAEFKDEGESLSALRGAIKNLYTAGDIDYNTALQYLVEHGGLDEEDAFWKVEEWEYKTESGNDFGKYNEFYDAVQTGKNLKAVIKKYTDNGVTEKTLSSQITSHFKPIYIEMSNHDKAGIKGYLLNAMTVLGDTREEAMKDIAKWEFEGKHGFPYDNCKQQFLDGNISASEAKASIMAIEGKTSDEAENRVAKWRYELAHPELVDRITAEQYKRWETDGKPNGVSIELFTDVAEFRDDGGTTKDQTEVAAYIDSLPISTSQKDALWCCFWKASTLKNAPWR